MKKRRIKSSTIITIIIVLVILTVAGFGARPYIPFLAAQEIGGPAFRGTGGSGPRTATTVRVTPVIRDTIENSVVINGDVLATNQVQIFPTVGGRISRTFFQIGDTVRQGTVVAMVDPSRPGQVFSQSPVVSTIGGTVLQTPVSVGDTVSAQSTVLVVGDLSTLMVETHVPERFSNAARRGLEAQVTLEALPGEFFMAAVEEVSPVLDPSSRTVRIRLRFQGSMDPRIRAGMFATVSLVTDTRQNVAVIPRAAVINTYGSRIVFVVGEDNIAQRREVFLGLENEGFVEILSGLEIGELIVIAGQNFLSDGELIRIVE
ncbi:MAG: efflux RND transporter periplasmic adaptor subunit [Treponema sp.]|nr:efflux RND transporter periplasmic adaptor subunit [Treponema sp.]